MAEVKRAEVLFTVVTVNEDGSEEILYATLEKGVAPLVTSSEKVARQFYALGRDKALKTGERLKMLRFELTDEMNIGDPDGEEFRPITHT